MWEPTLHCWSKARAAAAVCVVGAAEPRRQRRQWRAAPVPGRPAPAPAAAADRCLFITGLAPARPMPTLVGAAGRGQAWPSTPVQPSTTKANRSIRYCFKIQHAAPRVRASYNSSVQHHPKLPRSEVALLRGAAAAAAMAGPRGGARAGRTAAAAAAPRQRWLLGRLARRAPTHRREVAVVVDRAQVVEHLQRAHERLRRGRVHEVKVHLRPKPSVQVECWGLVISSSRLHEQRWQLPRTQRAHSMRGEHLCTHRCTRACAHTHACPHTHERTHVHTHTHTHAQPQPHTRRTHGRPSSTARARVGARGWRQACTHLQLSVNVSFVCIRAPEGSGRWFQILVPRAATGPNSAVLAASTGQ